MEHISRHIQAIYDYLIAINTKLYIPTSREFESHQVHHKESDSNSLEKFRLLLFLFLQPISLNKEKTDINSVSFWYV